MARPAGVKNQDYDTKRTALVEAATSFVLQEDVLLPSFRQIAIATGTSEPTLKHYFKSRSGLVIAIIEHLNQLSDPMRAHLRRSFPSISEAMRDYQSVAQRMGKDARFMRGHIFGLRESLVDTEVFAAYVRNLVEPGVAAFAERIVKSPGGPVNYSTARTAASLVFAHVLFVAAREHLLGEADPDTTSLDRSYELMTNWLLNGMIGDPEGMRIDEDPAD